MHRNLQKNVMSAWPPFLEIKDLSPGDRVPHPDLPDGLELKIIEDIDDPAFEPAFEMLMQQFGALREMETREVIEARLGWKGKSIRDGKHMLYHLMAMYCGEACVGVRDHTAIVDPEKGPVIVHLSHVLVSPNWRRKGLVTLLRTIPVSTARELATLVGRPEAPITLFCEMDPLDMQDPPNRIRRLSYEKANFTGIASGSGYMQPDFRDTSVIANDPDGSRPVELDLLFRFVGNETRCTLQKEELLIAIRHVYSMYATGMENREMKPCFDWLEDFEFSARPIYSLFPPSRTK